MTMWALLRLLYRSAIVFISSQAMSPDLTFPKIFEAFRGLRMCINYTQRRRVREERESESRRERERGDMGL